MRTPQPPRRKHTARLGRRHALHLPTPSAASRGAVRVHAAPIEVAACVSAAPTQCGRAQTRPPRVMPSP
eukprot:1204770-Prymnesium_polylepis.1